MATTPEPQETDKSSEPTHSEATVQAPSKWRRLGWFVGLWAVSVFTLWVFSWVIRWAAT
ncbi:MAG TPA: DUF2474 domain-containing protein [Orrella sp.]